MADTTAASAEGSEAAPSSRSGPSTADLKRIWLIAAALVTLLAVLGALFELGSERVVSEGPLRVPVASAEAGDGVQLTPAFEVEGPTTLEVTLTREAADGWLGVGCALVEQESGAVREFGLASEWTSRTARGSQGALTASARVDRVESGGYVLRYSPEWEPVVEAIPGRAPTDPAPPPAASIRVTEGSRSPLTFFLALILLLIPALFSTARWHLQRRSASGL